MKTEPPLFTRRANILLVIAWILSLIVVPVITYLTK